MFYREQDRSGHDEGLRRKIVPHALEFALAHDFVIECDFCLACQQTFAHDVERRPQRLEFRDETLHKQVERLLDKDGGAAIENPQDHVQDDDFVLHASLDLLFEDFGRLVFQVDVAAIECLSAELCKGFELRFDLVAAGRNGHVELIKNASRPNDKLVLEVVLVDVGDEVAGALFFFLLTVSGLLRFGPHVEEVDGEPCTQLVKGFVVVDDGLLEQVRELTSGTKVHFPVEHGFQAEKDHAVPVEKLVELLEELWLVEAVLKLPDLQQDQSETLNQETGERKALSI